MSDLFKVEVSFEGASGGPYFCATVVDVYDDGVVVEFDERNDRNGLGGLSSERNAKGEINRDSINDNDEINKSKNDSQSDNEGNSIYNAKRRKIDHESKLINITSNNDQGDMKNGKNNKTDCNECSGEINRGSNNDQGEILSSTSGKKDSHKHENAHRIPFKNVRLPPKSSESSSLLFTVGQIVEVYTWRAGDENIASESSNHQFRWGWFQAVIKKVVQSGNLHMVQFLDNKVENREEITTDIVEKKFIREVNKNPPITKGTFVKTLLFMPSNLDHGSSGVSVMSQVQRALVVGKQDASANTISPECSDASEQTTLVTRNASEQTTIAVTRDASAQSAPSTREFSVGTEVDKTVTLNSDLMKLLECTVCLKFLDGHIFQCESGHPSCNSCKEKLKNECPTCKKPFIETRALLSEHMAELIHRPCKNIGCDVQLITSEQKEHEFDCKARPVKCTTSKCLWIGDVSKLADHIRSSKHKHHTVAVGKQGKLRFSHCISNRNEWAYCTDILIDDNMVQFCMIVNDVGNSWFCCRLFGTRSQAKTFRLKLELGTEIAHSQADNETQTVSQFKTTVDIHCDLEKEDGHCIPLLNYEGLKALGFISREGYMYAWYTLFLK